MSERPDTAPPAASAAARRTRYASTSVLLVTAASAIALFIAVLGSRFHARLDLTATRAHSLSPRTLATLGRLDGPVEIVVAAEFATIDADSAQRGLDLLEAFEARSGQVSVTTIPTGASSTAETAPAIDGVIRRVAELQSDQVRAHDEAVTAYIADLRALADQLDALDAPVDDLADALPVADNRDQQLRTLEQYREMFALFASQLRKRADDAEARAWLEVGGLRLAQADVAAQGGEPDARPVAGAQELLRGLQRQVIEPLSSRDDPAASANAAALSRPTQHALDLAAVANDRLARLKPLEPVVIARLFESTQVVLVVSQHGVSAVAVESIFPPSPAPGRPAPDQRAKGEELLATAIAALADDHRPIAVFVHGEKTRLFEGIGRPTPSAAAEFGAAVEKLTLRRIDCLEWAAAVDEHPPDFSALDPDRERPIVWVILPAPDDPSSFRGIADSSFGLARLTGAVEALRSAGESMLVSIEPSRDVLRGDADPLVQALAPLGVTVDSGRPIIQRIPGPSVSAIHAYQFVRQPEAGTPLTAAIDGLVSVLYLPMAVAPLEPAPDGVRYAPLLRTPVGGAANAWAEAQWWGLRRADAAAPFQPIAMAEPPQPDPAYDDPDGPWTVAAIVERERARVPRPEAALSPARSGPQRVVVVASPQWFDNATLFAGGGVDGRYVAAFPGNAELFENAVYWLAGRDELVGASPRVRDIPRVGALTPGQVSAIRWGLIGVAPLLILAVGAAVRLIRG